MECGRERVIGGGRRTCRGSGVRHEEEPVPTVMREGLGAGTPGVPSTGEPSRGLLLLWSWRVGPPLPGWPGRHWAVPGTGTQSHQPQLLSALSWTVSWESSPLYLGAAVAVLEVVT